MLHAQSLQSGQTLCNSMDNSQPGSSVQEFSRQEYWRGLPFPSPGDLPDPGIKPASLGISCLGRQVLYHWDTWDHNRAWGHKPGMQVPALGSSHQPLNLHLGNDCDTLWDSIWKLWMRVYVWSVCLACPDPAGSDLPFISPMGMTLSLESSQVD